MARTYDVVIIGGGPAGSTAGHLLAVQGHDVLLLEREIFPRFHIGESLLPCDLPIFQRLGIEMLGAYQYKSGAEFIDERTGERAVFEFANGLEGSPVAAWQVERSKFDLHLIESAKNAGVTVHQGEAVSAVDIDEAGVMVTSEGGSHRARYCVDATGQDAFFARRDRSVRPWKGFGRCAVFCHFEGLAPQAVAELTERGNIKILIIDEGWIWLIPLNGEKVSVGVVTRNGGVTPDLLDAVIAASPLTLGLTAGSRRTPSRVIRNFSFKNDNACGPRRVCIGDAAAFLDPVFSSGVSLAMLSAENMTEILGPALREGREHDPDLMAGQMRHMEVAYRSFGSLVHSFYDRELVRNFFFGGRQDPSIRAGVISLLAGDVWRTDNRFSNMLQSSSRHCLQEPDREDADGAQAEPQLSLKEARGRTGS